jgi:benzoyl-CoA reductase/2-hydroxyglutaryl-CoA dehydratase subunit BcrC/BadD/HgdB
MADYYNELFELCGFEVEEIDKERLRIERALQKLRLTHQDVEKAEGWVRENHDVELMGVRKLLGIWLKELIDLILAKDEGRKVVYYGFPTIAGPAAAIAAASEEVYCTCPDAVLCYTMGQIFNKLTPILEAGEVNGLPPGYGLCSLQQIRVGALALGIIPVPDLVITSSYYCDMGSKADELLHEKYGHPAVYADGSMDSRWGEFPNYLSERADFLGKQLEKVLDRAEEVLRVEITKEARYEGAYRSRDLYGALRELVELVKDAGIQPVSIVEVEMARRLTSGSTSRRVMTEGSKIIGLLNQEIRERINKGIGVVEKGAPRIMILMAHFSDPRIMRMMESTGLSIPVTVHTTLASRIMKNTPFISGEKIAKEQLERGPFHSSYGEIKRAAEAAQEFNVDGVIFNYLFNCRPIAMLSHLLEQFVERETGIPVLSLEMDMYDSRSYNEAGLRTRIEAFAEMLADRKIFSGP